MAEKKTTHRAWWAVPVLSLLVAALSFLAGHQFFDEHSFYRDLTNEICTAFLVAAILAVTIEVINDRRKELLMEEIATRVHRAVFKRSLPDGIFDECERTVLRATLYRDDDCVYYTLEGAGDGRVKLAARTVYYVVNATDAAAIYPVQVTVGRNPELPDEGVIDSFSIDDKALGEYALRSAIAVTEVEVTLTKNLEVPARGRVKLSMSYSQTQLPNQAFEVLCGILPSTGLHVEVMVPHADFFVHFCSLHPEPHKQAKQHDGKRMFAAELAGASLPGQGMLFYWQPTVRD